MQHTYYYVYRITNIKINKHYYGFRSSNILPKQDLGIKYFSSSKDIVFIQDQKVNPQDYKYKIIRIFDNPYSAISLEIKLHNKFDVGKNKNFYNRSKQTTKGFSTAGTTHVVTEETKQKIRETKLGKKNPMWGKKYSLSEETIEKIRNSNIGKKRSSLTRQRISVHQSQSTLLLDVNFEIVKTYNSCREIADDLGFTYSNIKNARRHKRMIGKSLDKKYYIVYLCDYLSIIKEEFTIYGDKNVI